MIILSKNEIFFVHCLPCRTHLLVYMHNLVLLPGYFPSNVNICYTCAIIFIIPKHFTMFIKLFQLTFRDSMSVSCFFFFHDWYVVKSCRHRRSPHVLVIVYLIPNIWSVNRQAIMPNFSWVYYTANDNDSTTCFPGLLSYTSTWGRR